MLKVWDNLLTIYENRIANSISIHRDTLFGLQLCQRLLKTKSGRRHLTALQEIRQHEFVIHKTVGDSQKGDGLEYLVGW